MTISGKAVQKPTTVLVIFILIIAFGIYSMFNLPIDMTPEMDLPYLLVSTSYENAGPEEVESSITKLLEKVLSSVTGLKKMSSQSQSGSSIVVLEMNYGTNMDAAKGDIRDKIDMVKKYLPDGIDPPVIFQMDPSMSPIMYVSLTGNHTPEELHTYGKDVIQPRLEQIDGIASAGIGGGREKCIRIDIPRNRLEAYSLTISSVMQLIGAQNIQSAGGVITSGDIRYTIQSSGKYKSVEDIKNTVISWKVSSGDEMIPMVHSIKLRDIADVYEGYKEETNLAFRNGEPCVMLMVQKQSGKNSVATAKKARAQLENVQKMLPSDINVEEVWNTTDDIQDTINAVINSVITGIILAVLVLIVFLRSFKSTLIIGLSIPISLMATLALMYLRGMTVNMISLAGLLIGVGMLVDNSIVVLENIYSYRQKDAKPQVAATLGAQEMVSAITSSTLTTVCIFLPMIMFTKQLGMFGQLFNDLAFTIIFSLLCSLIVAVVLVPVLCSKYLVIDNVGQRRDGKFSNINRALGNFFDKLDKGYSGIVAKTLRHKKVTLGCVLVLFVLSIFTIMKIGYILMPATASTNVTISVELPKGTKLEITEAVLHELDAIAHKEIKGLKNTNISVGGSGMMASSAETNTGTLRITLYKEKERQKGWDNDVTTKAKMRPYFTQFPGALITAEQSSSGSSGLVVEVRCDELELLGKTANELVNVIREKGKDFVTEVTTDWEDGLPEVKIIFDRDKMYSFGLTIASVGTEIKANIDGLTAGRYDDKGDEIDIIVSLPDEDKTKLADLDSIFVTNNNGQKIPLSSFARYEEDAAPIKIARQNQTRMTKVTVRSRTDISLNEIQARIDKIIAENIPQQDNLYITFSGDNADFKETATNLAAVIIMACALVFAVMASQFESFKDPFIVLFTMPLALIGVSLIYLIAGEKLNIVSLIGCLMLVGMIVNNGIVLVDYTNLLRKRGYNLFDACVEAARSRLRPILMSTLTTVIALVPMAFFANEGTEMIQPISLTVLGGLTFGSLMTLFVMPTLYYIFNSGKERKARKVQAKLAKQQKSLERK